MATPQLLPNGYLSTKGNQIVDSSGNPVRIASVGWNQNFNNFPSQVAAIRKAGFNCIRFSWVNSTITNDLNIIDQLVAAANASGIKVILDNHTNEPGHGPQDNWGAQQKNGLWYDLGGVSDGTDGGGNRGTTTDTKFLSDWVIVANRYKNNPTVIGFDIRNEPLAYGGMCTWEPGSNNPDRNIRWMYERVGKAIHAVDPGKLIICEGPQNYNSTFIGGGKAPWGDLSLAGQLPVKLDVPNKVVYSVHDYPLEIAGFSPDNGAEKIRLMNIAWGYLVKNDVAPVWIGEFGSSMTAPTAAAWAKTAVDYYNGKAVNGPVFTPGQQGIGTNWWVWGYLPGQLPDGTNNADGSLKLNQYQIYSQTFFTTSVIPIPTPLPPPVSPNGTIVNSIGGSPIITQAGEAWSLVQSIDHGVQIAANGLVDNLTGNVVLIAYIGGKVFQQNKAGGWWSKSISTDGWTATIDPLVQPTLVPTVTPIPVPTIIPTPTIIPIPGPTKESVVADLDKAALALRVVEQMLATIKADLLKL